MLCALVVSASFHPLFEVERARARTQRPQIYPQQTVGLIGEPSCNLIKTADASQRELLNFPDFS